MRYSSSYDDYGYKDFLIEASKWNITWKILLKERLLNL